jgi:uncharacterized membrane protein
MSERTLRATSVAVAVSGVAIAAYLLYVRHTGTALACTTGGCETVQKSAYAEVLGVPVAALGLAGYLGLIAAALARGEWARLSQATLALAALIFSAYLLYIQVAVIDAICQWCLASDLLTTALAFLALLRLRSGIAQKPPQPRPAGPRAIRRRRRVARAGSVRGSVGARAGRR